MNDEYIYYVIFREVADVSSLNRYLSIGMVEHSKQDIYGKQIYLEKVYHNTSECFILNLTQITK